MTSGNRDKTYGTEPWLDPASATQTLRLPRTETSSPFAEPFRQLVATIIEATVDHDMSSYCIATDSPKRSQCGEFTTFYAGKDEQGQLAGVLLRYMSNRRADPFSLKTTVRLYQPARCTITSLDIICDSTRSESFHARQQSRRRDEQKYLSMKESLLSGKDGVKQYMGGHRLGGQPEEIQRAINTIGYLCLKVGKPTTEAVERYHDTAPERVPYCTDRLLVISHPSEAQP